MTNKRTLSSFDQVANDSNINSETDSKSEVDMISDIMKGKKTKDQTHTFRGYYLENEVSDAIERITEGKTKGVKSELVNEILKRYFIDKGLM